MNEKLDFYQKQAQGRLSTLPWLEAMQKKALSELCQWGFPTRHDEEWKYTPVDELLTHEFSTTSKPTQHAPQVSDSPLKQGLTLHNGMIFGLEKLTKQLPKGVLVMPLSTAISQCPELITPYLGSILQPEHGFHALNTAMIQEGVFIYVPAGIVVEEPILLAHSQDNMNQAVYWRHVLVAEQNSQFSIVEDYQGPEGLCYFTNTVTEVCLAKDARLTHYKIQRESFKSYHVGHIAVKQAQSSQFESHSFSLGATLARSDLSMDLDEEHARCLMNAVYLTTQDQQVDHHTTVNHKVPNCLSEQDYKGVLSGRARAVFNGKIKVSKDAQHTCAKQQNKNLLLSKYAEINTKPQLEIFANDVVCSHGATVGQLDEDALFYLATRGIDRQQASHYLIQAFTIENLRLIRHSTIASWIEELLMKQVEAL